MTFQIPWVYVSLILHGLFLVLNLLPLVLHLLLPVLNLLPLELHLLPIILHFVLFWFVLHLLHLVLHFIVVAFMTHCIEFDTLLYCQYGGFESILFVFDGMKTKSENVELNTDHLNRIFDAYDKRKAKLRTTEAAIYRKNTCARRKRVKKGAFVQSTTLNASSRTPRPG